MKRLLIYIVPLLLLSETGCLKTNDSNNINSTSYPSGTYTGQFLRVHKNALKGTYDTLKANLQLTLNATNGFAVTGDTTTVHAGSTGPYAINPTYMYFADVTYPKTGIPLKVHLYGSYLYSYDGTTLLLLQANDTLSYQYTFRSK
jgi:hypothetical protein